MSDKAPINQSAVIYLKTLPAGVVERKIIFKAGQIAMEGHCSHARLCYAQNILAAALANAGPDDSDHDTHRYWRRNVVPLAHRLCDLAECAYDKLSAAA